MHCKSIVELSCITGGQFLVSRTFYPSNWGLNARTTRKNRFCGLLFSIDLKRPAGKQPAGKNPKLGNFEKLFGSGSGSKKKVGSGLVAGTRQCLLPTHSTSLWLRQPQCPLSVSATDSLLTIDDLVNWWDIKPPRLPPICVMSVSQVNFGTIFEAEDWLTFWSRTLINLWYDLKPIFVVIALNP